MKVRYNKGMGYPVEISDGKTAVCISLDAAKELQANLSAVIEQAENTPEEELTGFEYGMLRYAQDAANKKDDSEIIEITKTFAAELLAIAKEQLDIEILKDRAVELTKHLNESGLDENSIEHNLIEFMCNLMDCPNWSEIVETAGLHAGRIKAEAMKDLPRWESDWKTSMVDKPDIIGQYLCYKEHKIRISDLEKLPGFKED